MVKVTLKQIVVKNNICNIFVFTLVYFLELETREESIVPRANLYIWTTGGHELTAIGTLALEF